MWLETMTCRPPFGELGEKVDHLGAAHRVEAVEGLVEHQDPRVVAGGVGELDALPHALGVAGDAAPGGVGEPHPFEGGPRSGFRLGAGKAVQGEGVEQEGKTGRAAGKAVVLGTVADQPEELLGVVGAHAEDRDLAAARPQQTGHQVHQGALAGAVGTDEAGEAGCDVEVDPVDAEDLAVETGHTAEDDAVAAHRTTSCARSLRLSSQMLARVATTRVNQL